MITPDPSIRLEIIPAHERATAVISQAVAPGQLDAFLEWQQEVTSVACQFPGYVRTEVYEPPTGSSNPWVTLLHFVNANDLKNWLDSQERAELRVKLDKVGNYELKTVVGMESWFAVAESAAPIPGWKMVLAVVLALYPTVMLLGMTLNPWLSGLPFPITMLIGNLASVSILQWLVMPVVTQTLSAWLRPAKDANALAVGGAVGILATLIALAAFFEMIT